MRKWSSSPVTMASMRRARPPMSSTSSRWASERFSGSSSASQSAARRMPRSGARRSWETAAEKAWSSSLLRLSASAWIATFWEARSSS